MDPTIFNRVWIDVVSIGFSTCVGIQAQLTLYPCDVKVGHQARIQQLE
ncbi:MAG: hypothetical protein KAH18_08290 [Psychromonas sp.]|nr:hypothetical protein [Psychromonas sp.]